MSNIASRICLGLSLCISATTAELNASSFSANLTVNVVFPSSLADVLTVTPQMDAFLPPPVGKATGIAGVTKLGAPTSNFAKNTLTFTAGPIAGFAGPGVGSASAVSFGTSQSVQLDDLLAVMLPITLSGNYTYSVASMAQDMGAAGASVSFQIDNITTGNTIYGPVQMAVVSPPDSSANCKNCKIGALKFMIPPGVTSIEIDPFVSGKASSVPEPSDILAALCGLCLIAAARIRRKR
jgi:hypothetical protein